MEKERNKTTKTIRNRVCLLALLAITVIGLSGCGKTKIDLKDYVTIEATGTDGHGTLSVTLDYNRLGTDLGAEEKMGELKDAENYSDVANYFGTGSALAMLRCVADKSQGLKNGDEVKITAKNVEGVEEGFDASLSNTEFTYKVENLDPIKEIDPFEGVTLSYEGELNSYAGYQVVVNGKEEYGNMIAYKASKPEQFVPGASVTVTYEYSEARLADAGYVIPENAPKSKDFAIEGVDTFISSFADIDEGVLETMKKKGVSLIKSEYFGSDGSYNDIQTKLEERKDIEYDWNGANGKLVSSVDYECGYFKGLDNGNEVALMFKFKVKDRKTSATMHAVVKFENVIKKASGDIYVNYESSSYNYAIGYLDTSVSDIENELVTNNEFEKAN